MNKILDKEIFAKLIGTVNSTKRLDLDFIYDVYELAFTSINELEKQNILNFSQPINSITLFYYIVGEYTYSIAKRSDDEIIEFNHNDKIKIQMASVVADKYMSLDIFKFKPTVLANRYLPPISSLKIYINFMVNLLTQLPKNNPNETLVIDMLNKAASSLRCILKLLTGGFETEAMATWRTLHETECILILLDKYGDNLIQTYIKHMKYGIAFHSGLSSKEETDAEFVKLKAEMKEHELKSKDMKKFIEYGWLYHTDEGKQEGFKLNFRDGLEKAAGLSGYSKIYEQSSEIVHSTPMLIYSSKIYYYLLALVSTYESFFRIENIFSHWCFEGKFQSIVKQYEQMKKVYFPQLIAIYKNEVARLKELTNQ